MKNLKNILGLLFLAVAFIGQPLYAMRSDKSVDASVKRVDKEMSLLDQIVEQANIIVDSSDQEARTQARRELKKLMKREDLDVKIKDAIKDDIKIIKSPWTKTKRQLYEARISLLDTYGKIDSQANVVEAIAHATKMVKDASPEELDAMLIEAKQMIEKAEDEQRSTMGRWYAKAKRMVTSQVNYVFGEENSYAKTAFYAAAGVALLAAGAYVGLHGIDKIKGYTQKPAWEGVIRDFSPEFKASIKEKFGDDPEAQKEGLREILKDLEPKKLSLEKERDLLKKEHSTLQKQLEKLAERGNFRNEDFTDKYNDLELKRASVWKEMHEKDISLLPFNDYYDYYEYLTNPQGRVRVWKIETFEGPPAEDNVPQQNTTMESNGGAELQQEAEVVKHEQATKPMKVTKSKKKGYKKESMTMQREEWGRPVVESYEDFFENTGNRYMLELPKEDIRNRLGTIKDEIKQFVSKNEALERKWNEVNDTDYGNKQAELTRLKSEWDTNVDEQNKLRTEKYFLQYALQEREK